MPASSSAQRSLPRHQPDIPALCDLAAALLRAGHVDKAEGKYRQVLERAPDHAGAHFHLACILTEKARYAEARAAIEAAIACDPGMVKACFIGAVIESRAARYPRALAWIERGIALAPDEIRLRTRRAEILGHLGDHDAALADCDAVLARFPADVETLRVKASLLQDAARPDDALALLAAGPANPVLAVDRAWLLAELARKDEALAVLDATLAAAPAFAPALECRAVLAPPAAAHIAAMQAIVAARQTPANDRMRLSFALGRAHLAAGDGAQAFHYLHLGNGLKRKTIHYDSATEAQGFTAITRTFSASRMAGLAGAGVTGTAPLFVFGMPRSGTTLVEQIIAAHPLVHGAGETPHMDDIVRALPAATTQNLAHAAGDYLRRIARHAPPGKRIVDKSNANFRHAGPIALMLPDARMIHCRRDPLDTCLSNYGLLFTDGHEFSYDLAELGHYHALYRRLMAHWSAVIPPSQLLTLDYEALVADPRAQVARLLDFCGLPWDDACLRFHESGRTVTTSSLAQVRAPIYGSSAGRAEPFRPWLGDLIRALGEAAA